MAADQSYPIGLRNGLLTPEHRERMGIALWEFAWLVDRITEEYTNGGETRGKVLGGRLILAEEIVESLGGSVASVNDHLQRLFLAGYIIRHKGRHGYRIEVRNSQKWSYRFARDNTSTPTQSPVSTVPQQDEGTPQQQDNRTRGQTEISPPVEVSRRPSASIDNALSGNITLPSIQGEDAPASEGQQLWAAAADRIAGQTTPGAVEVIRACRVFQLAGDLISLTAPSEAAIERVERHHVMMQQALRQVTGRELDYYFVNPGFLNPNSEARAGPGEVVNDADGSARSQS